jgi:hypothetical protein
MRSLPLINRERVMNREIAFIAFTASIIGLFFIFDVFFPGWALSQAPSCWWSAGLCWLWQPWAAKQEPWEVSDEPVTSRRSQSIPLYPQPIAEDVRAMLAMASNEKFFVGAAVGTVATIAIGFSFGGWTLGSTARFVARTTSSIAVVAALAPICVDQFRQAPNVAKNLGDLQKLTRLQQMTFVQAGGWSLMPGGEAGGAAVAEACAAILIGDAPDDEPLSDRGSGSRGR